MNFVLCYLDKLDLDKLDKPMRPMRMPIPARRQATAVYSPRPSRDSVSNNALIQQLQSHLRTLDDLLSRLRFYVREFQQEALPSFEKPATASPVPTTTTTAPAPERRRTDLLRRATLSLLESSRRRL